MIRQSSSIDSIHSVSRQFSLFIPRSTKIRWIHPIYSIRLFLQRDSRTRVSSHWMRCCSVIEEIRVWPWLGFLARAKRANGGEGGKVGENSVTSRLMFAFYTAQRRVHYNSRWHSRRGETSTPTSWKAEGPRESFMIKELITVGILAHRFH